MLEFRVIENLKPNKYFTSILKGFKYNVKLGQIKTILPTNLKVITPTEYKITYLTTLTILEYKVNEISNKPFYFKEYNKKYNIKEITQFLKKVLILDYTFCLFVRKHLRSILIFLEF